MYAAVARVPPVVETSNPMMARMLQASAFVPKGPPAPSTCSSGCEDVLERETTSILDRAFTSTKPHAEFIEIFMPYQELYRNARQNWVITSSLHQNSKSDPLHLSLKYVSAVGPVMFFHVNGFYRGQFIFTDITIQRRDGTLETIARFGKYSE